ncbi:MAG: AP endonuclease [Deltaproteobacteria bacterium HGW-Deltaproteobacteria-7]|jgi:sugar phosphate isomerase/epimerase|nr:MAG: AP endonuclease [Deltaproteobacteria bacterium HGW-Deltaproteobacteria-7]PKN19796.1 MAG: AP endonuclease [Deltaproteobacteria bacterium HGW-Deltaproteobacteria-6]
MLAILKRVHTHMPYTLLSRHLPMILEKQLNLEIYFNHIALQALDKNECREHAARLKDAGLKVTFHAPFVDLRPGALDDQIRRTSLDRIRQVFDLIPYFQPLKIVCHPSFDDRYYVSCDDLWLENSINFWRQLIPLAKDGGVMIALENVYEKEPDILRRLLATLASDQVCFCFDTGHFNVFSHADLNTWMEQMGGYIGHLHLHDNFGKLDEHLPVGAATFPFDQFFAALQALKVKPTITLEAHSQDNLWKSLANLQKMSLLDRLD